MAQLDERGEALYEKIEEATQEAAQEASRGIENLGGYVQEFDVNVISLDDAAASFREAARLLDNAGRNQDRLDNL